MTRAILTAALCAAFVGGAAEAASVKASSTLTENDGTKHPATLAFDGQLLTAWAEGETGLGEGAWIELSFDRPTQVESVSIWPGDLRKGTRSLKENGRPHTVTVELIGATDGLGEPITAEGRLLDGAEVGIHRVDIPISGEARGVRITMDVAYGGFIYNDTYIAEIAVNFAQGDAGGALDDVGRWIASSRGTKARETHREEVIGLFDTIDQAEFGDRDSLRTLMDWASNGAPFLRERVRRDVPYGFRMKALPPDDVAVEALLKLRDANAIPALMMAASRLTGRDAASLQAKVTYFEAWSELNGGPRRNLQTWGEPGWEVGALKGLGEPLSVVQGVYGDLYIADVANHRLSIFKPDGTTRVVWGLGQPTVTNTWFSGTRRHYVSGKEPSTGKGGFTNPVDVDILKGRDSEEVAILDALGRVQRMSGEGEWLGGFTVAHETPISAGVGGEGHILYVKGSLVVVWGNEVVVFDPTSGEETARWDIEEGVPSSAVALKNGRLLLGFRDEAVMYSADGFRYGTQLDEGDLPRGFESWDMALDDKHKLWVVTDNGWAVKFKKPGKEDYRVRWTDYSVNVPRFTVNDDMLYVVADGTIEKVDALQRKAEAEAASSGEE